MKKYLKKGAGYFLVFLGIIGLFLPVLQGIVFLIAGFALLENETMLKFLKKFVKKEKKVVEEKISKLKVVYFDD